MDQRKRRTYPFTGGAGEVMKNKFNFFTIIFMLFFVGCQAVGQFIPRPDLSSSVVDSKMSRVYVVRPSGSGRLILSSIYANDKLIGTSRGVSYFCWEMKPGLLDLTVKGENADTLSLKTKPGETYYVLQRAKAGMVGLRSKLRLLSKTEGITKLKKCEPVKLYNS